MSIVPYEVLSRQAEINRLKAERAVVADRPILRIYISGAITGLPPGKARAVFREAAASLAAQGHETVNPFDVSPHANCKCAQVNGKHEWACCLRGDLAALLDCDAIFMLPGWESSHGARLELTVAAAVGLRVLL